MPSHPDSGRPAPVAPGVGASLEQWLAYLESIHPIGIDLGLDRVLLVLRRLFPHKPAGRIITVAGTNGKLFMLSRCQSVPAKPASRMNRI